MTSPRKARASTQRLVSGDAEGRTLTVTIRVGVDGMVYFQDIPPGLVPVALAVDPGNAGLAERAELAARFGTSNERRHGGEG